MSSTLQTCYKMTKISSWDSTPNFGLEIYLIIRVWQESERGLKLQMGSAGDLIAGKTFRDRWMVRIASFTQPI